jgi:multiple sugar transport system substrate-binding protein
MALSWPTHKSEDPNSTEGTEGAERESPGLPSVVGADVPGQSIGFVALPGSNEVYRMLDASWDERGPDDGGRVPLLAVAGRLGSVTRETPRARAAFTVLSWLTSRQRSGLISPASPATTLFRTSHLQGPGAWVSPTTGSRAASQYATIVSTTQNGSAWLSSIRLPGRAEYLAALDRAVHRAVRKEAEPAAALKEAAATWQEITARLGHDRQRNAYRRSIGLGP